MNYLTLPVYSNKEKILLMLENNQVLIVESPTGSGKTTQLPVILFEAGYANSGGIIGVTQPRRIAAVSVSEFIARQTGTQIPGLIGYKMRFADRTNHETKIKIMTDGILLQEMKLDPWLSKYNLLVIDEAHERSLNIDFILGLLKRILENRPEFKVIISSATINSQVFAEYFGSRLSGGQCPVVKIEAQTFPVTLIYDPPVLNVPQSNININRKNDNEFRPANKHERGYQNKKQKYETEQPPAQTIEEAILFKIETITTRIISEKREGDILIFLSGEKMIKDCINRLTFSSVGKYLHIIPLYGRLGKEEQERVFEKTPKGKIKVVVSTNIAETSITIDGITSVIDSGLAKLNWYNPRTFTSSLIEGPISKASANQRKGRAGRTREGTCYRLYSRKDFESRPLYTTEEIFRTDLSEVILRMADLGITNFEEFDFIAPPEKSGLLGGIETLNLLDALEKDRSLSKTGKLMTEFPLAPRQSRIIVEAILRYPDVLRETIIAAAFLSTQSPYVLPPGEETDARQAHHRFRDDSGDFVSYLKLFKAYNDSTNKTKFCEKNYIDEKAMAEIVNVTIQLEEIVSSLKIPIHQRTAPLEGAPNGGDISDYLYCIARGMIQFVCVLEGHGRNSSYSSLTADKIIIHPGSVMFRADPHFIVAGEIVRTSRTYAMSVSPLSWEIIERLGLENNPEFAARRKSRTGISRTENANGGHSNRERTKENGRKPESSPKRTRDFTNNIKIDNEIFEIETIKGKKVVLLPWEKLSRIGENANHKFIEDSVYKKLKGKIIVKNRFNLLNGEKLELILSLAPALDVENTFTRSWPRKENFNSKENLYLLLEHLDDLARPIIWKKDSNDLGFLGLFTDGDGNYRFRASRGFHTSVNESLASLEALIDEMGEDIPIEQKHIVNQCYRRLSDYLI